MGKLSILTSLVSEGPRRRLSTSTIPLPLFPPIMMQPIQHKRTRHVTPAVMMRSGTSKGLFLHRNQLPANSADWAAPLLAAMGSSCGDPRQIDGVGGGSSTTSKIAVVSPSTLPGVDVEYTFVQVAVGKDKIDLSGNCGNMASGVGPFAVQEGLVRAAPGQKTVRLIQCLKSV